MIKILITSLFFINTVSGQTPIFRNNNRIIIQPYKSIENDTTLKILYADSTNNNQDCALFLNSKSISKTLIRTLDPKQIEDFQIIKDSIKIDDVLYYWQIHIKTKKNYIPKVISLTGLKEKYTSLKDKSTMFMIDGEIIDADYDNYFVDENFLLRIIIDKIENKKENVHLRLIKLLTKSEKNIEDSKKIRIRGMNTQPL